MAIVRSHTVWGARKSAGGVTYRQVRGRTIMGQKRGPNPKGATRADGQVMTYREAIFAVITAAAKVLAASINVSFDKTKYGSRRNDFFRRNYQYFEELAQAPISDADVPFAQTLQSFGMQAGQTVVAALQAGIIDTSAVEIAMQASETAGTYGFMAITSWSENSGSDARYIRADIGDNLIVSQASDPWGIGDNPLEKPVITSFIGKTTGTGESMMLVSFELRGRNLSSLAIGEAKIRPSYQVAGGYVNGTWSADGSTFTLPSPTPVTVGSSHSYYVEFGNDTIAMTTVYGSPQTSAGGE